MAGSQSQAQSGCQQEKPLIDNAPIKPLCFVNCTRRVSEAFDGMKCPACHPPPHTSHYLPSPPPCVIPQHSDVGLNRLAAVSQQEQGCGRGHRGSVLADCWQTSRRGPITFPGCQEGVNPRGGGQTLGSMVTECVINAAMCPVPRTFSTPGPPSQPLVQTARSVGGEGASGPSLGHGICPERGYSLHRGLRQMTFVNREVMGDNRLVSNDGCVEGESIS